MKLNFFTILSVSAFCTLASCGNNAADNTSNDATEVTETVDPTVALNDAEKLAAANNAYADKVLADPKAEDEAYKELADVKTSLKESTYELTDADRQLIAEAWTNVENAQRVRDGKSPLSPEGRKESMEMNLRHLNSLKTVANIFRGY